MQVNIQLVDEHSLREMPNLYYNPKMKTSCNCYYVVVVFFGKSTAKEKSYAQSRPFCHRMTNMGKRF